ncbi:MAG TPA: hypothetical protein DCL77_04590 [Prolixibacteraceae bacterium]|jgi:hypothetical protein|nr:hypothetical protein [Prolixibacteraceae bacterium]
MGHIKEPAGVDFVINSRPLTKKEETAISEYIRTYKAKHSNKQIQTKRTPRKTTAQKNMEV